ncbi:Protein CBG12144 [Caenorhabditis briggsae]|uniref:Protein CBG12144 n=1 Tax=Caenorhabditis briggsae TaxID=6238 RepID=A8XEV0_CAEBR|nr:Protein CBG12144 [Caenorhabditis briggsae]CAP31172.2 Protein CBG12144 [Caenorhabditis briggsae]
MRQVLALFLVLAFLAENGNCAKNDTLEMELESNITVVKLEHGLKFAAHSEFGLPDNMTDLFNSTADDPEGVQIEIRQTIILRNRNKTGSKNSSLPVNLDYVRARRSNKDGEGVAKFFAKLLTSGSTKQYETVLATISKIPETIEIRGPPGFPDHRDPDGKQWPIPTTTTRRMFVMYEDDDLVKKNAEKENKPKNDFKNDRDFDDSDSKEWRSD